MQDHNLIINLKEKLKSLTLMYRNLEELLVKLSSVIDNEEFIPEHLKDSIHDVLSLISKSQSEFMQQYSTLEIGDPDKRIPRVNEILEVQLALLSEKNEFKTIVNYVKGLQSADGDVSAALQKEKDFVLSFDLEEASIEKCKESLGKYSILQQAVEEADPKKRFDLAFSSLLGLFEKDILFGIMNGSVFFRADNEDVENPKESVAVSDIQDNIVLKDISEPKSTSSNQSDHDSFEQNIYEREDSVNEQVPEKVLAFDNCSELQVKDGDDNDQWEDLGIYDRSNVTYDVHNLHMKVNTPPKPKKFNASSFKKELSFGPLAIFKLYTLRHAFDHHGMVPASAASLFNKDKDEFKSAADRLVKTGYLSEYVLLENGFDKYHSYYMLTPSGIKAFRSKEATAALQIEHDPSASLVYKAPASTGDLLARLLAAYSFELFAKTGEIEYINEPPIFYDSAFITQFPIRKSETESPAKTFLFTGIYSSNFDDFEHYKDYLQIFEKKADTLVVIGMSQTHAKAVASWIDVLFEIPAIIYYDFSSDKYYSLDTDSEIDFSKLTLSSKDREEDFSVSVETDSESEKSVPEIKVPETDASESIDAIIHGYTEAVDATSANDTSETVIIDTEKDAKIDVESLVNVESSRLEKESTASTNNVLPAIEAEEVSVLHSDQRQSYDDAYLQMLSEEKFYCATAYLYVLAKQYNEYSQTYTQIAYALNDPLINCNYNSDNISSLYFEKEVAFSEYYAVSASLRNFFLDQQHYDHSLRGLYSMISGLSLLQDNNALQHAAYTLMLFKADHHRGIDFYADYRQKNRERYEDILREIRKDAREFHEKYCIKQDDGFSPRMGETRKILFGDGSDIKTFLEAIMETDQTYLELMKDYLSSKYIKSKLDVAADNIDHLLIEQVIDDAWEEAGKRIPKKKGSRGKLTGVYRASTVNQVEKAVMILTNYVSVVTTTDTDENDPGLVDYKRKKDSLIKDISDAITIVLDGEEDSLEDTAGKKVLLHTLYGLISRLDGSYDEDTKKYFYLDFLRSDKVLLDERFLPVFNDVTEIDGLSILARIEDHVNTPLMSFEERLISINSGQDDYGSAALILHYLESHPLLFNRDNLLQIDLSRSIAQARNGMPSKRDSFIGDLELAQSYGQIDNTVENRKEAYIQIMAFWYDWAMDTNNYGFFYKILKSIRDKIREDAQIRAVELDRNLSAFLSAHSDWEEDERSASAIEQIKGRIEKQNYAAAEDLLNRLIAGDLDNDIVFIQHDYLKEFLEEYSTNFDKSGKANNPLRSSSIARGHNKDSRGAGKILDNWPISSYSVSADKIQGLMSALGFPVSNVEKQTSYKGTDKGNFQQYHVRIRRPENGRKSNYKHPISVFGSEAEENGFRVITIFGRMDAGRLIDTFKEIGSAHTTIVLLDFALTLPDRRELARRTKTEYSKKTFIVIDRVVAVYLARHYSETAINRMLMAVTMPFASYQPYISESAKIMPQEIFMGRTTELDKIESASGVNIVCGGRQLGKSALLRMAQKDVDRNENGNRAVLVDIKGRDYKAAARRISEALLDERILETDVTDNWDELSRNIRNRLRENSPGKRIPYLLLLLDEADDFIDSCEKVGYRPFDALKDIQNIGVGRFKFVVAGLRNIVRFNKNKALSNNSVLTHLSALTVTPFKSTEARELLEVPLSYLGFRFRDDSNTEMLISTIFGHTNYFPGLLQLYCSKLIEAVQRDYAGYNEDETPPYVVSESHIKKVLSDKTLEEEIRNKFFITLRVGNDDYYYLIALLVAFNYHNNKNQNGCDANDILEIASSYGISKISSLSRDKVTALMEEMLELNVLQRIGNGKYRFARHNFCEMMGRMSQIDDEIIEYAMKQET